MRPSSTRSLYRFLLVNRNPNPWRRRCQSPPLSSPSPSLTLHHHHLHPPPPSPQLPTSRPFTAPPELDVNKAVDEINIKFAEAREEIESAMESKETVYFDEEAECARAVAKEVLDMFEGLVRRLEDREKERNAVVRSMGLKIEQLKAELQQLDD